MIEKTIARYWIIGRSDPNRTQEDAEAVFKSEGAREKGPSLSGWVEAWDGSYKGESWVPKNDLDKQLLQTKLFNPQGPSIYPVHISGKELLRVGGLETKDGALCNYQNNQQWLFLKGSVPGICGARVRSGTRCQCKGCWDGTLCEGTQKISSEQIQQDKGFNNQKGVFCEDQNKNWIYLKNSDTRRCDSKCFCATCWDEEGCPRRGNITKEQLVAEKGMQTDDGVSCELWWGWDVIRKEDRRICDFNCDCQTCWDELFCP